ncbi:FkbM family methyltransferase [Roseobacter sp. AzwK-3b]|uniref:FkbM family methyltransferase n=1 Tax=Roseobacter sp. AzwK-3b TaxID=351016 RepID=UPI000A02F35B|nr:FkbM family methyltransferase [Roseobacter sp. AzwK-3b]
MTDNNPHVVERELNQHDLSQLNALSAIATASNAPKHGTRYRLIFGLKTAKCLDNLYFRLIEKLDIDVLVECGAHEGTASFRAVTELKKSAIAIEANPYVFRQKTLQLQKYGVMALNFALDTTAGQVALKVPKGKSNSSTKGSLLPRTEGATEEVTCEARTLDSIAAQYLPERNSVGLWIDVEGATSRVLRGASKILQGGRCKIIKVEVESVSFWQNQTKAHEIDLYLRKHKFVPIARDCEYRNQYNIIYVPMRYLEPVESDVFCFWQDLGRLKLAPSDWIFPFSLQRNRLILNRSSVFRRLAAILRP